MAEDRNDSREISWRQLMPWTELFRGFQIALDLNKMLLAALGILVMAFGWWLLSVAFYASFSEMPTWAEKEGGKTAADFVEYRKQRTHWNLMHEAINLDKQGADKQGAAHSKIRVEDVAETLAEYDLINPLVENSAPNTAAKKVRDFLAAEELKPKGERLSAALIATYRAHAPRYDLVGHDKPAGRLSAMPWSEDRGPNPYLLVTNQAGIVWEPGHFWEWFTRDQVPVMIEPLVKMVRPIVYLLSPRNDFTSRLYFSLILFWTLVTWSLFGGAITRIAAVQYARGERIGLFEALAFARRRLLDYLLAPLFPLGFALLLLVFMWIFGIFALIPVVGDILVSGLFWVVPLVFGLIMAIALVGLVGWPLMAATISTEGTDSWEAVSRSYSYVYQRPWNFIWYSVMSVLYGGIVVFFVGFMASFAVQLAKVGVNNAGYFGRGPSFLFIYAPTSFGWRELLLEGTRVDASEEAVSKDPLLKRVNGSEVVQGRANRAMSEGAVGGISRWSRINEEAYQGYLKTLNWWNKVGAAMVAFWLGLAFLLVLGFGYSFFWTASTVMYFLLRRSVDTNELDEVYQEDDDFDAGYMPASTPATHQASTVPASTNPRTLPMVSPSPVSTPAPTPAPAPAPAPVAPPPSVSEPPPSPPSDGSPPPLA